MCIWGKFKPTCCFPLNFSVLDIYNKNCPLFLFGFPNGIRTQFSFFMYQRLSVSPFFRERKEKEEKNGLPRECALCNFPVKISVLLNPVCVGILKWSLSLTVLFSFTHACLVFRCGVTPLPRSSTLLGLGLEAC